MAYETYDDEEWVDEDEDSGDDLLMCPSCKNAVHEDTQQCPHCGDWIIPVYPVERSKRVVFLIAAALLILALVAVTIF
jgi:predicted nucleic acid-binding Zn ribbon protein